MQAKTNQEIQAENQKKYQHYNDTRQQYEIELTNRLARSLTEINMKTLEQKIMKTSTNKPIKKQDFLYVCLPGVPPFENEFAFLQLPGECLYFPFTCFDKNLTQAELIQLRTEFDEQAKMLHKRINETSTTKPLVFVYHSYGCYVFAVYCQLFKNDRIIGIIDSGGAPITCYPGIKRQINNLNGMSLDFVLKNLDSVFEKANQVNRKFKIGLFQNKFQLLGIARTIVSGTGFEKMFQYNRNLPKVLKCFIFGRKDSIFDQNFMSQKVIHYTLRNKFEAEYSSRLQKTYLRCFGIKSDNIQQKFIYSIEEGLHTIHLQKRLKDVTSKIVNQYLTFLQEVLITEANL